MEAFAIWLLKSMVWLTGFTLVFILFLRNERFFVWNRIYLVAGILTSLIFPFISVHYTVELVSTGGFQAGEAVAFTAQDSRNTGIPILETGFFALYFSGVLFVIIRLIRQTGKVLKTVKSAETISVIPVKLMKTTDNTPAFSFFSLVFVNPSVTDIETREILKDRKSVV